MYNLTVALDPEIVREAQMLAVGEGLTLNEKVSEFLQQYAKFGSAALETKEFRANNAHLYANSKV